MKRRIFSLLLVICMMISMMPVAAFAEEGTEDGHDHSPVQVTEETTVETTVEVTEETTEETTAETTEETIVEETQEATQPVTEPEPVCNCGTDDAAFHVTNCPLYEAPEDPQCFCAEKCQEPNLWCDVCGFDYTACGGEDRAVTYDEPCTHTVTVQLEVIGGNYQENSNQDYRKLVDGNKNTKWCNEFGAAGSNYVIFTTGDPVVIASYTLTTASDAASFPERNWKSWVLYGGNSKDGPWKPIHSVEDRRLPAENSKDSDPFQVDYHSHRAFFKLELNAVNSEDPSALHQLAEITIRKSAMVNSVCTECQTPCPHDIWKGVNCMRCGIYCIHENYSDGACTGCGLKCPHENYNGGICDLCKWECPHTGTYEDGICTVCGNTCEHPAESMQNGTCQLCGWVCSHTVMPVGVAGTSGSNTAENYDKLIDRNVHTKWCSPYSTDGSKAYIILKYDQPQALQSYFLATANDAASYPERNWKSWTIYGSNSLDDDSWTQIDKQTNQELPRENHTPSAVFTVNSTVKYLYYKVVVEAVRDSSTQNLQQLAELCLNTVLKPEGNGYRCALCQNSFSQCPHKLFNGICLLCGGSCSHVWENGFCTICGDPHSHGKSDFTNSICTTCGYECPHAAYNKEGKCTLCGYTCTHDDDAVCGPCGFCGWERPHSYTAQGFCQHCDGYQKPDYNSTTDCWEISNAGQLFWFSQDCSKDQYAFRSVLLTADIDLTDCPDWIPILGKDGYPFYGTFDGGGHTITGLHITNDASGRMLGLFGIIGDANTTVKNLRFSKARITDADHKDCFIGTLAGINRGVVENIYILGDCYLENVKYKPNIGTTTHLDNVVGGIAGENTGTIRTSRNDGQLNKRDTWNHYIGARYSGGIAGTNSGLIENCCNWGGVYTNDDGAGIAVINGGSIVNCVGQGAIQAFDDSGFDGAGDDTLGFNGQRYGVASGGNIVNSFSNLARSDEEYATIPYTTADRTSGRLTYLLQNYYEIQMGGENLLWGQNVDNGNTPEDRPVLFGTAKVYQHQDCVGNYFYSNISEPETLHLVYENGMCKACHLIEKVPERDDEGVYLIGNAGELLWFAEHCKEVGHGRFNARLTADIVVNENALSGTPAIAWPVIENFWGDFNGDGHTISGLYVAQTEGQSAGMFAYVQASGGFDGTIRNLRIADSYISGTGAVGGIVGNMAWSGTIENCSFTGKVVCTGGVTAQNGEYYEYAGGLVGRNVGTVENSYANATVICGGNAKGAGGLVGRNTGSLDNCYFNSNTFLGYPSGNDTCNGESTFQDWHLDHFEEDRTAQQFASGEVAYLMQRYYEEKMDGENLLWGQTIGINPYPIFACSRVLEAKDCQGNTCYSNTNDIVHYYGADEICTKCGDKFCAHSMTAQLAYVSGSKGYGGEEDQNLLDGNRDTKWCAKFEADGANYVVFTTGDASVITSYTLTTAGDTGSNSGRNWKSWTLYGSNRADGGWVLINQVKDADLPAEDHAVSDRFFVDRPAPYTYYKLVLNAIEVAGTTSHQMADITIQKVYFRDGICTHCGDACPHSNWENNVCTTCGKTNAPIVITQQPTNGEAKLGERYCVEVRAVGEGLQYQWYMKNAGSKSFSKSSVTDNTYDDVMTKARADREVYCVITDAHGNKVTTDTVRLICLLGEELAITKQPNNASAKLGEIFCVSVEAKGDGLKYKWYWRNVGSEYWNVSGQKDNTYDDEMTSARHNREVKCVITDAWGNTLETETVVITGTPTVTLAITRQPESQSVALGEQFNVNFDAVGDGLKYQWYFRPVGEESWRTSGQKDNSYDDVMTEARHNRELYCLVTDAWGNQVATDPIVTIMASAQYELAITKQPRDASAKLGENFCVSVEAQGDGLKYKWYWRDMGSEYWNVSGQRDNTYDDVMTKARNNREVKCVITDLWGNTAESEIATITGIPEVALAITSQPVNTSAKLGERYCVTVEAQGDDLTYTWYFRNPGASGWSRSSVKDNTYDDVMTKARANRDVYCVITDALGNQVKTDIVVLELSQ